MRRDEYGQFVRREDELMGSGPGAVTRGEAEDRFAPWLGDGRPDTIPDHGGYPSGIRSHTEIRIDADQRPDGGED